MKKLEKWYWTALKNSARYKNKSLRQRSKDLIKKDKWEIIPRNLYAVPEVYW